MTLSWVVEPGIGMMVGKPLRPLYDRTLMTDCQHLSFLHLELQVESSDNAKHRIEE